MVPDVIGRKWLPEPDGLLGPDNDAMANHSGSLDGVLHWNGVLLIPWSAYTLPFQLSHVRGAQSGLFYTRHLVWQGPFERHVTR